MRWSMGAAVTYWIELAVGMGCVGAASVAFRSGHRWIAAASATAGVVAIVHAGSELLPMG